MTLRGAFLRTCHIAAVTALGSTALAMPATAQTPAAPGAPATSAVPVKIDSCNVLQWQRPIRPDYGYYWRPFDYYPRVGPQVPVTDGLAINYTNHGPVAANRIEFQVDYRGEVEDIVDVGTFSPGVSIKHMFGNFSGLAYLGSRPNHCRVLAVRYEGGRTWRRQGRAPAPTH